ncbi:MAG: hypothetical protein ACPG21_01535 [Crocinitomicaceae bacterium]
MRTFELKPHQKEILEDINKLDLRRLHYLVIQQNQNNPNLTLNELKKHIKRGVKLYTQSLLGYKYKNGVENKLIQYVCFFETSEDFFWSQHINSIVGEEINMNLHFHLFISSNKGLVFVPQLVNDIILQLLSQKNKSRSIKKIDYDSINELDFDFKTYHVKQMMYRPSPSFYLSNI